MKNPWKKIKSRPAYKNPYFSIREDDVIKPDGRKGKYYVIETKPSVFIVAMTPKQEIFLIRLHRYTTGVHSWEIPGGNSDGENLLKAAKRELWEETGLKAKRWKKIGTFQAWNGPSGEMSNVFLAQELSATGSDQAKQEGITTVKKFPLQKVLQMIKTGELTDSQSVVAITQAALYLRSI